jgi:hypothetical protein
VYFKKNNKSNYDECVKNYQVEKGKKKKKRKRIELKRKTKSCFFLQLGLGRADRAILY